MHWTSAFCFAGHSIVECALHSIASIGIYHSDVVDGGLPSLALNVLIEIWYAVVQVASHSKNPRVHHGSQRKLSTALSSDLTSFIATNFSNDDFVHEEERKEGSTRRSIASTAIAMATTSQLLGRSEGLGFEYRSEISEVRTATPFGLVSCLYSGRGAPVHRRRRRLAIMEL